MKAARHVRKSGSIQYQSLEDVAHSQCPFIFLDKKFKTFLRLVKNLIVEVNPIKSNYIPIMFIKVCNRKFAGILKNSSSLRSLIGYIGALLWLMLSVN